MLNIILHNILNLCVSYVAAQLLKDYFLYNFLSDIYYIKNFVITKGTPNGRSILWHLYRQCASF